MELVAIPRLIVFILVMDRFHHALMPLLDLHQLLTTSATHPVYNDLSFTAEKIQITKAMHVEGFVISALQVFCVSFCFTP